MADLSFHVQSIEPMAQAASPTLAAKLRIVNDQPTEQIHNVLLQCQIQIEAPRRRYSEREHHRLVDLFGEPQRWGQTLGALTWTHVSMTVPAFTGSIVTDLPVPCTYDFNMAAPKYFDGLEDGEAPLRLLFSGTVFYANPSGMLQVMPISWSKEASYRMPVRIWREMIQRYYPNAACFWLDKAMFDRLREYRSRCGLATWEQAVESLLVAAESPTQNQVTP